MNAHANLLIGLILGALLACEAQRWSGSDRQALDDAFGAGRTEQALVDCQRALSLSRAQ